MSKNLRHEGIVSWGSSKLLALHEWMKARPLILSFILSSSCLLFSFILVFCGDKIPSPFTLTKYDNDDHLRLTGLGWGISIISWVWTFLIEAADKYYQYKHDKDMANAEAVNFIRERVGTRIVNVCNNKYNTLISLISRVVSGKAKPSFIISKPKEQLKTMSKEMAACLRSLLIHNGYNLNENEMYVSLFYKFHTSEKWRQADSMFPEVGLSITDVTTNPNSTFSQVLNSKNGIIFINDKQAGLHLGQYIPDKDDKYDDDSNLKGSILCYRIICKKDDINLITAVLSISTYNKRIEPSNQSDKVKNTQDNICNYIITEFEKRIKIELCLLYLSELYSEHKKKNKAKTKPLKNFAISNLNGSEEKS